jgi:hypothetical protein
MKKLYPSDSSDFFVLVLNHKVKNILFLFCTLFVQYVTIPDPNFARHGYKQIIQTA